MSNKNAKETVDLFNSFLREHKDKIEALCIVNAKPYGKRGLTKEQISTLANAIQKPPYGLSILTLWNAYRELDNARVRGSEPEAHITNVISLVAYAVGDTDLLEPYKDTTTKRFNKWIYEQEVEGRKFTPAQLKWLAMMKDHIGECLSISIKDLELEPFSEHGGTPAANEAFPDQLDEIIEELNGVLSS
ncbi:MAG: hypothetical protein IH874_06935 [Candidatus Dadabacteria bacterium]|nr:hypothetical protein [Candidatus Dadabacteria bacterium]